MSYYERPRRRRTSSGPVLLLAATAVCLMVTAGAFIGWQLLGRQVATPPATAVANTPVAGGGVAAQPTIQATRPPSATPDPAQVVIPPDLATLQALALDLINQDRAAAGLSPVAWDADAAGLAQRHAEDMLAGQFFSHWNRDGFGPDHRAALNASMTDAVFENIHAFWRTSNGKPAPIEDWPQRILDAHESLMDSPGHRRNILDPAHTHVGIGIAYRPDTGELRVVQEFVNRYVALDPLPARLPVGAEIEITGRLLNGASDPLVNLAYEPFPAPMSVEELDETGSYAPAARFYSAPRTAAEGDLFGTRVTLDHDGRSGLYHVWVFVTVSGEQVLVAAPIVIAE